MAEPSILRNYGTFESIKDDKREPIMDVDDMLAYAGDFGRYQYFLMFLFAILNILSAFHYFGTIFVGDLPVHWCRVPESNLDFTNETIRDLWTPSNDRRCSRFDVNMSDLTSSEGSANWPVRPCDKGWDYDRVRGYESIATEMNWVCADVWKATFGMSMFFVGCVIGTFCLGIMADRVGRLHVLVIANLIAVAGNVATSFTTDFTGYVACRFLAGMATDNNFVMLYIIVLEYMRPSKRTLGLNLTIGVFYTIGSVALPWVALAIGNWRHFLIITTAPMLIVPLFYWTVPESARWLLSKGKVDRAIKCFERVARCNGKKLNPRTIDEFKNSVDTTGQQSTPSLVGLFRTRNLRRKTSILIFKSIVLTLCYDAISRNVTGLGFDSFTVFSITSITTLPACIIILMLQDRLGRKALASASLLFTGLCMIISAAILATRGNKEPMIVISLSFLGRLGINVAYNSGVQYAAELIPTEVRGQGVSAIHMAGYLILFSSPYILLSEQYWVATPTLLLGTLAILGAFFCLFLPETLNRTLPVTLADGERFGEGEKMWSFACCQGTTNTGQFLSTEELVIQNERY